MYFAVVTGYITIHVPMKAFSKITSIIMMIDTCETKYIFKYLMTHFVVGRTITK